MGLFFRGRMILTETVLKHLLGRDIEPISKWDAKKRKANYDTEGLPNRIWLWKNLRTGYIIATGDEGNSWEIELARGSRDEVMEQLRKKKLIPTLAGTELDRIA